MLSGGCQPSEITSRTSANTEGENVMGTPRTQSAFAKTPRSSPVKTERTLNLPSGMRGSWTFATAAFD